MNIRSGLISSYHKQLKDACVESYEAEEEIIDWIYEAGELDFLPKQVR